MNTFILQPATVVDLSNIGHKCLPSQAKDSQQHQFMHFAITNLDGIIENLPDFNFGVLEETANGPISINLTIGQVVVCNVSTAVGFSNKADEKQKYNNPIFWLIYERDSDKSSLFMEGSKSLASNILAASLFPKCQNLTLGEFHIVV